MSRTDFVPDGPRAQLVGLTLRSDSDTTVPLEMAAHSELMATYPWGETTPSQLAVNADDTGSVDDSALVFREQAGADHPLGAHDWAAVVGSDLTPVSTELGPDLRGPQDPAVICPASGTPDPQPERCDDTAYGAGTGGRLRYDVAVPANKPVTVWFAVAGSDKGLADARASYDEALADPRALLADKVAGAARDRPAYPGGPAGRPPARAVDPLEQAEPRRLGAGEPRPAAALGRRRQAVPAAGRHAADGPVAGRGLARLPVDLRHRR